VAALPLALLHGSLTDLPAWDSWHFSWSTLLGTAALAGAYLWGAAAARQRLGGPAGFPWARAAVFLAGCGVLILSLNGPLHELSDYYLLSAHMVQHALLTMVVPLLWLLGTPGWLVDPLIARPRVRHIARALTHPVSAFAIYNGYLILWHLPPAYDWTLWSHEVHVAQHVGFLATGVLMWWPVASPTMRLPGLSYGPAMLYLFLMTIPMKAIGAFVTLADHVLYDFYASAPRVLDLSSSEDQTIAGLLMWMPGGVIYWSAIAFIFWRWYRREVELPGPHAARPAALT
jgi:putative membrane protein